MLSCLLGLAKGGASLHDEDVGERQPDVCDPVTQQLHVCRAAIVERKNLVKMKTALDECNEYHDRLHEVALASIDFDLDDGVVVNYAKFGDVLAKIK